MVPLNESISHGTLLVEDLLQAFWSVLEEEGESLESPRWADAKFMLEFEEIPDNYGSLAGWVLEDMQYMLEEYAPDGYYFGTIEGDRSDFGFWQVNEDDF